MKERDQVIARGFDQALSRFHDEVQPLPGLEKEAARDVFVRQLVESVHRVEYVRRIRDRDVSEKRADPEHPIFDPVKAALHHFRAGSVDEAFWCVFLFIYFGRHSKGGYRYAKEVYSGLGEPTWTWARVIEDPADFNRWMEKNRDYVARREIPGGFGSHRKRESLKQTGRVVISYVEWVDPPRTHAELFTSVVDEAERDPKRAFDLLYHSMASVYRFGRTARFDYLTMVGKLGFAPIEPGSTYLEGATGPLAGARLLFGPSAAGASRTQLDRYLIQLGASLGVGMQVVEDALCNWQKSPETFKAFRG